jgi:hypothetical protein
MNTPFEPFQMQKAEVENPVKQFIFRTASLFGTVPEIILGPHQKHSADRLQEIYVWEAPPLLSMDVRQESIESGSHTGKYPSFIRHSQVFERVQSVKPPFSSRIDKTSRKFRRHQVKSEFERQEFRAAV